MNIRDCFRHTEKLYHFTSFESATNIIESNSLRFDHLSNMNDIHENDKAVYVDTNRTKIKEFPTALLDSLYDEIYKYRQISLTVDSNTGKLGFDLHQMWGLYADKGEGVCLVFDKCELEKQYDPNIIPNMVSYDKEVDSFYISLSHNLSDVQSDIRRNVLDLFFHKRKEWEHEQEYRLLKRCSIVNKDEYLSLGQSLKFIIISSKLRGRKDDSYFAKLAELNKKADRIPILVYGNGLLDYSLDTSDGIETIWDTEEGYEVLIPGVNCKLDF